MSIQRLADGGMVLDGTANLTVVQGPAGQPGQQGPAGPAGPAGPVGPAGQSGGGARIVDANGVLVGPVFSMGTTYGSLGYHDPSGHLWILDMEEGSLRPMQTLSNTWTLYTQSNCTGPGYIQFGANGSGSRTALVNAAFLRDTEYRVRTGSVLQTLPGSVLSYRTLSTGACTNVAGTPFDAQYGPYILVTATQVISKPATSWAVPLRLAF